MDYKITVGIPVYNAGKYVEKCILSVLGQTLGDLELLVIDDHGIDNSIDIINHVAAAHPKGNCLRIVDYGENRGVAYARNTIIREARGKYVFFMDQDDYIAPETLALMYEKAEELQAEAVWGSYQAIVEGTDAHCQSKERHYEYKELIGLDQLIMYECCNLRENLQHTIWNILFLVSFFRENNLQFEQHGYFDDTIMHARMQPLIKRAVLLPNVTYTWNIHAGSGSNFQYRNHFDIREAMNAIEGSRVIIEHCKLLVSKSYYDVKCAKVMKQAFFTCCGILKHRQQMNGKVSNKQLRTWLQHPATFRQILMFKRYRSINLAFWLLGKMPPCVMVAIILLVGKKKGFL